MASVTEDSRVSIPILHVRIRGIHLQGHKQRQSPLVKWEVRRRVRRRQFWVQILRYVTYYDPTRTSTNPPSLHPVHNLETLVNAHLQSRDIVVKVFTPEPRGKV